MGALLPQTCLLPWFPLALEGPLHRIQRIDWPSQAGLQGSSHYTKSSHEDLSISQMSPKEYFLGEPERLAGYDR